MRRLRCALRACRGAGREGPGSSSLGGGQWLWTRAAGGAGEAAEGGGRCRVVAHGAGAAAFPRVQRRRGLSSSATIAGVGAPAAPGGGVGGGIGPFLEAAEENLEVLRRHMDVENMERRISEIDAEVAKPEAYTSASQDSVAKLLKERSILESQVSSLNDLAQDLDACREMYELAATEGEGDLVEECMATAQVLGVKAQKLKVAALLSSLGDAASAPAYVEIAAGAGGLESTLWASMLVKMYTKWAQGKQYSVRTEAEHRVEGNSGVKSTTLVIDGHQAYGWLSMEAGVHRMVRMANGKRQTCFAQVQVYPVVEDELTLQSIDLPASDLRVETMRSQGAGGQHVNTTDSAVRITHIPSGTTALCQDERSQHRNKEKAMQILRGKLYAQLQAAKLAQKQEQRASLGDNSWGNQIRSYVLAPYQMVKDHRTGEETGNVDPVLENGEIDAFIESALVAGLTGS